MKLFVEQLWPLVWSSLHLQCIYQTYQCCLSLCHPAPNTPGIIAAAIISVLLLIIIIAIILLCWFRARNRKKYEKEICNEIRYNVQNTGEPLACYLCLFWQNTILLKIA